MGGGDGHSTQQKIVENMLYVPALQKLRQNLEHQIENGEKSNFRCEFLISNEMSKCACVFRRFHNLILNYYTDAGTRQAHPDY